MSNKIRKVNGKKYYGQFDITSEDENEDFGFSDYKPNSEGSTDIEDFYYYLTNEISPSSKEYNETPSYTEMKKALTNFINDEIDKKIEKLGIYSNYYTNKSDDKYSKYLSRSTSSSRLDDLHTKEANKYKKQIRKFAKIYSDINEALNKTDSDIIVSLYEKYIDPNFTNFNDKAKKEKASDQEEAYKQVEKGARNYLEDPEDRYPSAGIVKPNGKVHEYKKLEVIDASKPKAEEEKKSSVKKPQTIEPKYGVFDWKYGNPNMERPKDLPDPEDRFKR